jgi:hypothetical protein
MNSSMLKGTIGKSHDSECIDLIAARENHDEILDNFASLYGSRSTLTMRQPASPSAFVAATYGRLTGNPGICISALGPGMLNFCFISKGRV